MTTETTIDPIRLARLIETEEAEFNARHTDSRAMTERASRSLAGGVASSWQSTDPHPIYLAEGHGSKVVDVDGNEYVDFHNGYGAMAVGHAHPKIVEAVSERGRRAVPTSPSRPRMSSPSPSICSERFGLPLWRFANSGTESTLDAVRLMRAYTGRDILLKIEGSYHGHHDAVMVSVAPPADKIGDYDDPASVPQTLGLPAKSSTLTRVVPFNDLDAWSERSQRYQGQVAGHDRRAGDDERRHRRCPTTAIWPGVKDAAARPGALLDLRRGQDRRHHRTTAARPSASASPPT